MSIEMEQRRRYQQRQRAERFAETRRRITDATLGLHKTVGPAATSISEIARRAGVRRLTVYNHFATDADLIAACSGHWRSLHPTPALATLDAIDDPALRLREGLSRVYGWFRETEPMTANVLRDKELVPALGPIIDAGLGAYLAAAARVLAQPLGQGLAKDRAAAVETAARAALDFHLWRALKALGDDKAAALAATMVEAAARSPAGRHKAGASIGGPCSTTKNSSFSKRRSSTSRPRSRTAGCSTTSKTC